MTSFAVPPDQPRRLTTTDRIGAAAGKPERIRRIHSGDRAAVANAARAVVPEPPRRRVPRTRHQS